ncbi:MAG: hypothetical protein HY861_00170 [Chlamydiia bacterium]|nr:hypothetical protein [Chlamydiia bacterium]
MIIEYANNKLCLNANDLAKAVAEVSVTASVLFVAKLLLSDLGSVSGNFYNKYCDSPVGTVSCFTNYTMAESVSWMNTGVDKVGGVFAFTSILFLLEGAFALGSRAVSHISAKSSSFRQGACSDSGVNARISGGDKLFSVKMVSYTKRNK